MQPPSGGCVLKHYDESSSDHLDTAATFGWLCIETTQGISAGVTISAATFGWLCIETACFFSFNRRMTGSHLRVAVY